MNNNQDQKISQHQKRILIIEFLYDYFLENNLMNVDTEIENQINNISDQIKQIVKDIFWYQPAIIAKINQNLKPGWKFNDLKPTDKAILVLATYEIIYTRTDKAIIINEAIILAKQFCDQNVYRYINGVLDKIN